MAHKKGVGSSKNGRESQSKRLGVKIFGSKWARKTDVQFLLSLQKMQKHKFPNKK